MFPELAPPLLDQLSTALILIDTDRRIHYLNTAAESLLVRSRSRAIGQHLGELIDNIDNIEQQIQRLEMGHSVVRHHETPIQPSHSGEATIVELTVSHLEQTIAGDRKPYMVLELVALNRSLEIRRAHQRGLQDQAISSMLRGLAHEIKNPLGGLRGSAQLLLRETSDPALTEYIEIIVRESDRLSGLVDRMLAPEHPPDLRLLNIHEVLEHVRKLLAADHDYPIEIECLYDPSIPEFKSDHDRLVQCIFNIARNALQAAVSAHGPEGRVTFQTATRNHVTILGQTHKFVIVVRIGDNGDGIAEAVQSALFFPMVTGRAEGSGLGLSISYSVIRQLGGLIEYHTEPGNTEFSILIPFIT